MSDKKITLYSLSTCGHCRSTKQLLTECSVEFDYYEIDKLEGDEKKSVLATVREINPRCSFPTLSVDDSVIIGYKVEEIKEALGK